MSNKKSLKTNAILNMIRVLVSIALPLITVPYISRVLSVNNVGNFNFSTNMVSYFILLSGLGINSYAVREGSKILNDRNQITDFSSQIFSLNLSSSIISYILLITLNYYIGGNHKITIAILSLNVLLSFMTMEWFYTIREDFLYITIRNVGFQILSLILILALVKTNNDYYVYVIIMCLSTSIPNIINYIHSRKYMKLDFTFDFINHLKPIIILFASTLAVQIYVNIDTTMLGFINGDKAVGYYSIANKIYMILKSLCNATIMVFVPRLCRLFGMGCREQYQNYLNLLIRVISLLVIPLVIALIMLARPLVLILGGDKYILSTIPLMLLAFAIPFSCFNMAFSNCVLLPNNREKFILVTSVIGAAINLMLNWILLPVFSFKAAAFTTVVSELIVFVLTIWYIKKNNLLSLDKEFGIRLIKIMVNSMPIILIIYLVMKYINNPFSDVFTSFVISFPIYIIITVETDRDLSQIVKNVINSKRKST